jgi:hypothetical protein
MRRLALLLVVLPLAACGGSKSSAPPSNLTPVAYVKSAALKTAQVPSEHATLTASVAAAGQAVALSGAGDFNNTHRIGSMHLDFSVAGLSSTLDEVLSGTTIYLQSPLFSASLPSGKTWLKLDLQKALATKGIDFSALLSQNPAETLSQLQSSGAVTKVGGETIDGVDTTHYRGTIDPSKLSQDAGAKIAALANAKYGPYDVWIGNDDGYVHRMALSYSLKVKGAQREAITMTMGFSNYGKDVTVHIPSDSVSFDGTNKAILGLGG